MKALLVTGAWKCTQNNLDAIEKLGYKIFFHKNESEELPIPYESIEGVICNGLFLYHPVTKFTSLKFVQLTSAGLDRVPIDYMKDHGIQVFNAGGVYSIPMAEFALAGVLYLYKQIRFFNDMQQSAKWEKHRGLCELYGKTVCIVGCGSVGGECAIRFNAFGCRVIGVDIYPRKDDLYSDMYSTNELHIALGQSDILILTLPLKEETRHIMNKEAFAATKDGAVIVNIARGPLIDESALIEALGSKLGGAVLDVFEQEPLSQESPLWSMKNVLITPHNSFVGNGNEDRLMKKIFENLRSVGNG